MYRFFTSRNIKDVRDSLAMAWLMPQNTMVTSVDGDIYYQRTGRVPIRPEGYDYSKPVDGSTSKRGYNYASTTAVATAWNRGTGCEADPQPWSSPPDSADSPVPDIGAWKLCENNI